MNKIYQKTLSGGINAGFTLIELLVVVLIIGVLAAIALPQYKRSVELSKMAQIQVAADAISRKMKIYYMERGDYDELWTSTGMGYINQQLQKKGYSTSTYSGIEEPTIRYGVTISRYSDSDSYAALDVHADRGDVAITCWALAPKKEVDSMGEYLCRAMGYTQKYTCNASGRPFTNGYCVYKK